MRQFNSQTRPVGSNYRLGAHIKSNYRLGGTHIFFKITDHFFLFFFYFFFLGGGGIFVQIIGGAPPVPPPPPYSYGPADTLVIFNSKSKKCCWGIVSENVELFRNLCFLVVFYINFLDFPESQCNVNRSVWSRLGHFDKGCFSMSRERALFAFQPDFFTSLTPAHLSIHTHIIMHTLSLSDFGQNNQRSK